MGRQDVPDVTTGAEAIQGYCDRLRHQMHVLRAVASRSTLDEPQRRITALRACLDRLDGIREEVHAVVVQARRQAGVSADAADLERGTKIVNQQRGLHAQGMGWEERLSVYLLANRVLEMGKRADERALQEARDLEFYCRDLTRSLDSARLEAIQLMRAQVTMTDEDYYHFVAEIDPEGTG